MYPMHDRLHKLIAEYVNEEKVLAIAKAVLAGSLSGST